MRIAEILANEIIALNNTKGGSFSLIFRCYIFCTLAESLAVFKLTPHSSHGAQVAARFRSIVYLNLYTFCSSSLPTLFFSSQTETQFGNSPAICLVFCCLLFAFVFIICLLGPSDGDEDGGERRGRKRRLRGDGDGEATAAHLVVVKFWHS